MADRKGLNDRQLVKLIDSGLTQAEAARQLGVSRQAVSQRLQELRGKTTKVIVSKKIEEVTESRLDAIQQLSRINTRANEMLDQAEEAEDHHLSVKIMNEIRGQLKLQLEIFQTLYDLQAVQEFQDSVLEAISEAAPEVRNAVIAKLNQKRSLRQAVRFS